MPGTTLEAIYEDGVLRLARPIDLANGTRVDVTVTPRTDSAAAVNGPVRANRTPAQLVAEVAAMPMESPAEDFSGEDHDRILYGSPDGVRSWASCSSATN
jgi:predicted DNA-binding antitoxin AbrB/MazE fold protein